eukprot:1152316-Pelagomonas_calceolata.AAC.7
MATSPQKPARTRCMAWSSLTPRPASSLRYVCCTVGVAAGMESSNACWFAAMLAWMAHDFASLCSKQPVRMCARLLGCTHTVHVACAALFQHDHGPKRTAALQKQWRKGSLCDAFVCVPQAEHVLIGGRHASGLVEPLNATFIYAMHLASLSHSMPPHGHRPAAAVVLSQILWLMFPRQSSKLYVDFLLFMSFLVVRQLE